jgi:hypothetical protein
LTYLVYQTLRRRAPYRGRITPTAFERGAVF